MSADKHLIAGWLRAFRYTVSRCEFPAQMNYRADGGRCASGRGCMGRDRVETGMSAWLDYIHSPLFGELTGRAGEVYLRFGMREFKGICTGVGVDGRGSCGTFLTGEETPKKGSYSGRS